MNRRDFFTAAAVLVVAPKLVEQVGVHVNPVIANGWIPQWSERDGRYELVARTWELGERTHIEPFGWCVCVQKGTDETARWKRCNPPVGIYNIRAV